MQAGFDQSLYGIAAFAFGSLLAAPFLVNLGLAPRVAEYEPDTRLPIAYVGLGALFYVLLSTALGSLPTANSIIATGENLIVAGVGLCCWTAWRDGDKRRFAIWVGAAFVFPLITIFTRGFIAAGVGATACVLFFVSTMVRSRARIVAAAALVGYLGLSVFVSYMRDRNEIRASVWGGASAANRVGRLAKTAGTFEWFDPANLDHLNRIDGRLNQNMLVGAAVVRMEEMGGYAHGETIWDAFLALIPRALWPDKPMEAGSGHLVSQYTGIQFAGGTSVGIGHVMEFYINFGAWGVILGFAVLGVVIAIVDAFAAQRLANGDLHGFVLLYLPGISLLQVGGSLMEMTTSAAASIFVAFLANKYLKRLRRNEAGERRRGGISGREIERAVGGRVTEILGVFPSFDSETFGGVQTTGRQAWASVLDGFGANRAQSLFYRNGEPKIAAVVSAVRLRHARRVLVWHLRLAKLLPILARPETHVTVFLHGIEAWRRQDRLMRFALRGVRLFLSNSDFTWSRFVESNPEFARFAQHTVHLGFGAASAHASLPGAPPAAVMIGRLRRGEDYKGHREMIAAWPAVLETVPDAELWIVGDGDLRPDLEQLARETGVAERVLFYGEVPDFEKERLIDRSRCLALPSAGEGFGLVYVEAMRLGRPCLVSTLDAGREVVNPPEAGLAVDPAEPAAIAVAVRRLLKASPEWDAFSGRARQRYEGHFTGAHFQQRLLAALVNS